MDNVELTYKQKCRIESKKKKAKALVQMIKYNTDCDVGEIAKSPNIECGRLKIPGVTVTIDNYRRLIQERYSHKIMAMERPKLYLCVDDLKEHASDPQPPLYMADLQRLLLYILQGPRACVKPRWCRLLRVARISHIVLVVLNGVSDDDLITYSHCFPNISSTFKTSVDMVCSEQYGVPLTEEIFVVQPVSVERKSDSTSNTNKLKVANQSPQDKCEERTQALRSEEESEGESEGERSDGAVSQWKHDCYSRTRLMLNKTEMIHEVFPVPVYTRNHTYEGFVFTSDDYASPSPRSPMFGVDCEMCLTTLCRNELTRISVVNENMEVVYDTMVKPNNAIVDYLTQFSGITKQLLDPVTTRLSDVQQFIRSLLPSDAILVGHSLCGDLRAMKMFHPYVIDTSVVYNTKGEYGRKTSLKDLTRIFLGRSIQNHGGKGHSSAEDSIATLELVLLKLQHDVAFGDSLQEGQMAPSFKMHENWYLDMIRGKSTPVGAATPALVDEAECLEKGDANSDELNNVSQSPYEKRKVKRKDAKMFKKMKLSEETSENKVNNDEVSPSGVTHAVNGETTQGDVRGESMQTDPGSSQGVICKDNTRTGTINRSMQPLDSGSNSRQEPGLYVNSGQKSHFFSRPMSGHTSLLQYAANGHKSVSLINETRLPSHMFAGFPDTELIETETDKKAQIEGIKKAQESDVAWVRLRKYERLLESGAVDNALIENCLRKLDRRATKIINAAPLHSVCMVIMPGRAHVSGDHNAKVFLKTQTPPSS